MHIRIPLLPKSLSAAYRGYFFAFLTYCYADNFWQYHDFSQNSTINLLLYTKYRSNIHPFFT